MPKTKSKTTDYPQGPAGEVRLGKVYNLALRQLTSLDEQIEAFSEGEKTELLGQLDLDVAACTTGFRLLKYEGFEDYSAFESTIRQAAREHKITDEVLIEKAIRICAQGLLES